MSDFSNLLASLTGTGLQQTDPHLFNTVKGLIDGLNRIQTSNDTVRTIVTSYLGTSLNPTVTGTLIGVRTYTAGTSTTYGPSGGTNSIIIQAIGGGGGGAGVAVGTAGTVNFGGGGSSAGWFQKRLTTNFNGASIVVGSKGTGGASGANNGNDGGNTTFTDLASVVYTAGGGKLGKYTGSFAPPMMSNIGSGAMASPGTATNGDLNIPGETPVIGYQSTNSVGWSAYGARSYWGPASPGVAIGSTNFGADGANATGFGAGGAGGITNGSGGGSHKGGDGSDGLMLIWEFA